jgi:response regulator RpfG family c-di-GMP phosphodiesterase
MTAGPVIIIDDDEDDKEMMEEILRELNLINPIVWFTKTKDAFEYLITSPLQPFIIFSDINLPGESGVNFKKLIDDDPPLKKKSIPFVFFSTAADPITVNEVYGQMTVQGYFQKPNTYSEMKKILKLIVAYWTDCKHPNSSNSQ